MRISLIAALGTNWVIGNQGKLPWHLPADLKRFRALTNGHAVVMGRKTAESLGKPLPARKNLALTGEPKNCPNGFLPVPSLEGAVEVARITGHKEIFFIGGGQVFQAALPLVDRMYLTIISSDFAGDAEFPGVDFGDCELWDLVACEKRAPDKKNPYELRFTIWDRVRKK